MRYSLAGKSPEVQQKFTQGEVVSLSIPHPEIDRFLGKKNGRKISIKPTTFDNLSMIEGFNIASKTSWFTRGPGNQTVAIYQSKGEAAIRFDMHRKAMKLRTEIDRLPNTTTARVYSSFEHQGFACDDASDTEYETAKEEISKRTITSQAPVSIVKDADSVHCYVLIGDPLDPTWGDDDTAVYDLWRATAVAHTFGELKEPIKDYRASVVKTWKPGDEVDFSLETALEQAPIPTSEVNEYLKDNDAPTLDEHPALLHRVAKKSHLMWGPEYSSSAKDVSTIYTDGKRTAVFNHQSIKYLNAYKAALKACEEEGFPDNF